MTISRNVSLLAGVTMVLGGVFGFSVEAMAAPADIFNPLLSDIRQQLPPGTNLRLPAYFPASSLTLYPHIEADERGFRVNITADPNCGVSSCALGSIGILSETESWPPTADTVAPISLPSGLEGYHLSWGQGWLKSHTIVWRQDGQIYGAGTLASAVDTEELVAIAESMIREQPINSAR
ncbi:MAG: hypothetical protein AAGI69_16085 [Cyanobacteria bacterium P01_H01_bin.21]